MEEETKQDLKKKGMVIGAIAMLAAALAALLLLAKKIVGSTKDVRPDR